MHPLLLTFALLAQTEYLRDAYASDAKEYAFERSDKPGEPLELLSKPIMRWSNDDDWSGDVFLWSDAGRPAVVGCMLSGPGGATNRLVFHEFHLLATEPLAPADLLTRRRWSPEKGLAVQKIEHAPEPAMTATGRLTQMRQLAKEFTAYMDASGTWELRLLPQPLHRWGKEGSAITDGGMFGYVWPKGTDLEVILLLECRTTDDGPRWHFAPVRFSNRSVWLERRGQEVWRVEPHSEPNDKSTSLLYTTAYAKTIPRTPPVKETTDE